jgi:hypothetical protein
MIRFAKETLLSGFILLVLADLLMLGPGICLRAGLATTIYLVVFPILVYLALPLRIPLMAVEVMPSLVLMSWFHSEPVFAILAGGVFFAVPFGVQWWRRMARRKREAS